MFEDLFFIEARQKGQQRALLTKLARHQNREAIKPERAYQIGVLHMDLGEYGLAIEFLSIATSASPPHAPMFVALGQAFLGAEDVYHALEMFGRALQIDPGNAAAHAGLAKAYCAVGAPKKAVVHANIAAEALSRADDAALRGRLPPSILCTSLPKSASTFLFYTLKQALRLEHRPVGVQSAKNHLDFYVVENFLRYFSLGGCVSHDHIPPTDYNVDQLLRVWPGKIWVHVRDPRDAAVSAYYQYLGEGQGHGKERLHRLRKISIQREHLASLGYRTDDEIKAYVSSILLTSYIDFIFGWLKAYVQHPHRIIITTFESMVSNKTRFFEELMSALDLDMVALSGLSFDPYFPENRLRSGRPGEWRAFFGEQGNITYDHNKFNFVMNRLNGLNHFA